MSFYKRTNVTVFKEMLYLSLSKRNKQRNPAYKRTDSVVKCPLEKDYFPEHDHNASSFRKTKNCGVAITGFHYLF